MPAGPVGSVWAPGVWADTVWEAGVWGEAGAGVTLVPPFHMADIDAASSALALEASAPSVAGVSATAPSIGLTGSRPTFG
jgi:hypothetical protein